MIGYFNDKDKTELLGLGSVYKSTDGNIYKRELTEDELLGMGKGETAKKKDEARKTILKKYSPTDQLNAIMDAIVNGTDISGMYNEIQGIVTEYKTNGKSANFTNLK